MMGFLVQKAYAATTNGPVAHGFGDLLNSVEDNIVYPIIYLLMALAVIYFLWGVVGFIQNADNAEKRQEGYQHMIWGIIGIFIMVSATGIINIIRNTLGATV
jgi:uncharacterized membrane protein YidH (DUF202 family)